MIAALLIVNIVTFLLFGADKAFAKTRRWRVPEAVLVSSMFVGGVAGAFLGMVFFRHKTRHQAFWVALVIASVFLLLFLAILQTVPMPVIRSDHIACWGQSP